MKQNMIYLLALAMFIGFGSCRAQRLSSDSKLSLDRQFVDTNLRDAARQIEFLASHIKENELPTTYKAGKYVNMSSSWWCSGFFPGTALYLYEATGDKKLLDIGIGKLKYLEKEKYNKRTHDLGFMLYCSFGNALRLTGDSAKYRDVLTTGAESLATRYSDVTKTIRSWDGGSWSYPVIIDNMMNLEFLSEVSKISGNPKYLQIAKSHANTTLEQHFRKDYSSYHVVDYDPKSGGVVAKKNSTGCL